MKKSKQPKVSIVIPMYKSKPYLDKCIKSVLATNYSNFEVVIIIDGGDSETLNLIEKNFSDYRLRVFPLKNRVWLSGTRTKGFLESKGKYVALLDHDVEVHPNWIKEHLAVIRSNPKIAATQGKTMDIHQRKTIQTVAILLYRHFGWVLCQGLGETDCGQYKNIRPSLAGATNSMFKKDVVKKIGYYDKALKFNIDDLDLAIRLWISGYKTVTSPDAIIHHWTAKKKKLRGQMIGRIKWEYEFAKLPRVILKNYELKNIIKYLPIVYTAFLLRSFINLIKGNPSPLIGFIKAFVWNIYKLPETLSERKTVQNMRRVGDSEWMKQISVDGSIFKTVFEYMVPLRQKVMKIFPS